MISPLVLYIQKAASLENTKPNTLNMISVYTYQELQYRISVMKSLNCYLRQAPLTKDGNLIKGHYKNLVSFLEHMASERTFKESADTETQKKRETARKSLIDVIADGLGRFAKPEEPEDYKKHVTSLICTVVPVWMQYRDAFFHIDKEI